MGGGGGGLQHFSVSPMPLGFWFETKGLGPGLDIRVLSVVSKNIFSRLRALFNFLKTNVKVFFKTNFEIF